jgi:ribonuclease P protein component
VVPKLGFTIVRRNKLKRQLRELARQNLLPKVGSWDVLMRAKRDAYAASFERLRADIDQVAAQLT